MRDSYIQVLFSRSATRPIKVQQRYYVDGQTLTFRKVTINLREIMKTSDDAIYQLLLRI